MTSVPVRMYVAPALNVSTEVDSQTEAENFPGVVIRDITHNDGSQNKVSVKVRGSVKDIYPTSSKDINFVGTYGASPYYKHIWNIMLGVRGWYNCIELFREY